jgi:hypothetical protein
MTHEILTFRIHSTQTFKTSIVAIFGIFLLLSLTEDAKARSSARISDLIIMGSHISEVHDLKKLRKTMKLKRLKLGFQHQYFRLFYLPIWGETTGHYVLYTKNRQNVAKYEFMDTKTERALALALGKERLEPEPFSIWSMTWGNVPLFAILGYLWFGSRKRQVA